MHLYYRTASHRTRKSDRSKSPLPIKSSLRCLILGTVKTFGSQHPVAASRATKIQTGSARNRIKEAQIDRTNHNTTSLIFWWNPAQYIHLQQHKPRLGFAKRTNGFRDPCNLGRRCVHWCCHRHLPSSWHTLSINISVLSLARMLESDIPSQAISRLPSSMGAHLLKHMFKNCSSPHRRA
jgi:hypothetical protein